LLKFIQLPVDKRFELNRTAKVHCKARTSIDSSNLKLKWIKGDTELLLKSLGIAGHMQQDHSQTQQHLNLNEGLLTKLKQLIDLNRLDELNSVNNETANIKDENGYLIIKQMTKSNEVCIYNVILLV
jgi:hypothetical protein